MVTRRWLAALCRSSRATVVLLLGLTAAAAADTRVSRPFEGVTLVERSEIEPRPVRMHITQIDLRARGIRVLVSPPGGGREVVREPTLTFLKRVGAQVAVNAHFFLPFPSTDEEAWVIGLAASDGRVFSAFERPEQSFALVPDAPALNIDRKNRARIVHRDPMAGDGVHVRERATLWNTVAG